MAYVKLFGSILDSTVWRAPPAIKVVWVTMLAMADRDGEVMASVPGLADRARVPRRVCDRALKLFLSPDRDSRTKDDDGRRIKVIDGGWLILNYEKYREKDDAESARIKNRARQERWRKRHGITLRNVTVTQASPSPSPSPPTTSGSGVGSRPPRQTRKESDRLVAGTDAKIAELRAIADKPLTPEEVEGLRALRNGAGGS